MFFKKKEEKRVPLTKIKDKLNEKEVDLTYQYLDYTGDAENAIAVMIVNLAERVEKLESLINGKSKTMIDQEKFKNERANLVKHHIGTMKGEGLFYCEKVGLYHTWEYPDNFFDKHVKCTRCLNCSREKTLNMPIPGDPCNNESGR